MSDLFAVSDRCRLRRCAVASQRISAPFANAKRTSDFIFSIPATGSRSNQSRLGLGEGEIYLPSLTCRKKVFACHAFFLILLPNASDHAGYKTLSKNFPTCFGDKFFLRIFFVQVKVPRGAIIAPLGTPSSVKNFAGVVKEVKKIKSSVLFDWSKCALTCCFATLLRRKRPILHK